MQMLKISLPEYTVNHAPDYKEIGQKVDDVLRKHFLNQKIVVRGLASSEHPEMTADELIKIIKDLGTDRYDEKRTGDRYENIGNRHIDLFGVPATLTPESKVFETIVYGFYHSALGVHGKPQRIDVAIVYDASKLDQVLHQYEGREDIKDDGFAFKDTNHKARAVLGVIKLTD